jgi:hypothetical protein
MPFRNARRRANTANSCGLKTSLKSTEIGDGTVNATIREVLATGLYRRSSSIAVGGEGTARHVGVGEHRYCPAKEQGMMRRDHGGAASS